MLRQALPEIVTELPGPHSKALLERRKKATVNAVGSMYPVTIKRGAGAMIEDLDGNMFVDFIGGVGVLNAGYAHPKLVKAAKEQSEMFFHSMFNITTHEGYVALAEKLNALAPVTGEEHQTFFANSGAEADENAIKIARGATGRKGVISFSRAFHGRTLLTSTLTAKKAYAAGIGADAPNIFRADYPYLYRKNEKLSDEEYYKECLQSIFDVFEEGIPAEEVACMILEPLQGEGGFIPAPMPWFKAVRAICDKYGIVMIVDEVQSGIYRTGQVYASCYYAKEGVKPDIITTAKSLAAGLPISGCIVNKEIADKLKPGTIGGTFCGNAVACQVALEVLKLMKEEHLDQRGMEIADIVNGRYAQMKKKYKIVGDFRGLGPMIGLEIVKDAKTKEPAPDYVKKIITYAYNHGLLIESAGLYGNVIRFLAPLVITDEQLKAGLDIIEEAILEICEGR